MMIHVGQDALPYMTHRDWFRWEKKFPEAAENLAITARAAEVAFLRRESAAGRLSATLQTWLTILEEGGGK